MHDQLRYLEGECKHFRPDKTRTAIQINRDFREKGSAILSLHFGTCEITGDRYERCEMCRETCQYMVPKHRRVY